MELFVLESVGIWYSVDTSEVQKRAMVEDMGFLMVSLLLNRLKSTY